MKMVSVITMFVILVFAAGCKMSSPSSETKTAFQVNNQQEQYTKVQPVPFYDWSLERDLVIQLYNMRNVRAVTHSVWRSNTGVVEGDCPSIGFGIPYDTSLTNPLVATSQDVEGHNHTYQGGALTSVEQPEPNGIFASKNTSATWVMCAGKAGQIEPIYVETKVTVYPYPVTVDYKTNRVTKSGSATVTIKNVRQ